MLSLVYLIGVLPMTAMPVCDGIVSLIQIRSNPILPHFSDYSTNGNNQAHD